MNVRDDHQNPSIQIKPVRRGDTRCHLEAKSNKPKSIRRGANTPRSQSRKQTVKVQKGNLHELKRKPKSKLHEDRSQRKPTINCKKSKVKVRKPESQLQESINKSQSRANCKKPQKKLLEVRNKRQHKEAARPLSTHPRSGNIGSYPKPANLLDLTVHLPKSSQPFTRHFEM